jgi:hypothetical protein
MLVDQKNACRFVLDILVVGLRQVNTTLTALVTKSTAYLLPAVCQIQTIPSISNSYNRSNYFIQNILRGFLHAEREICNGAGRRHAARGQ